VSDVIERASVWVAPLSFVAAVVGCWLWNLGFYEYIGKHPHCRDCGFDLTGRAPDSARCSECGALLDEPGAITTGRRVCPVSRRVAMAYILFVVFCLFVLRFYHFYLVTIRLIRGG
jgi:hypothetical protein